MSYAAATPDHDASAKPLPTAADPLIARMVADLRENGAIEVANSDNAGPDIIEAARVKLMHELCEPVTAEVTPGGIVFRRERAEQRRRA
jgi:hypothetical protein